MGSSAQNSSGVHRCRSRVRFNEVPEKVPKVPEKVWEVLVQSQVMFNRVPEKVPEKVLEKVWEALVQSQVRFNSVPEKVPEKVPGSLGSGEGSGEALVQSQVMFNRVLEKVPEKVPGGFGAEPGQVQQGSGEGSGEGLGGFVESQVGLTGFAAFQFTETKLRCIERCFAARFRKICKNATFRLLGISPKLIVYIWEISPAIHGIFCLKEGS